MFPPVTAASCQEHQAQWSMLAGAPRRPYQIDDFLRAGFSVVDDDQAAMCCP